MKGAENQKKVAKHCTNLILPLPVNTSNNSCSGKNSANWNLLRFSTRFKQNAFASDGRDSVKTMSQMMFVRVVTQTEKKNKLLKYFLTGGSRLTLGRQKLNLRTIRIAKSDFALLCESSNTYG